MQTTSYQRSIYCRDGKYPDCSKLLTYDDEYYSQGYVQSKKPFRVLTKEDVFQPYIFDHDFRSSKEGIDVGYMFYVRDVQCQSNYTAAQPNKVVFQLDGVVPDNING